MGLRQCLAIPLLCIILIRVFSQDVKADTGDKVEPDGQTVTTQATADQGAAKPEVESNTKSDGGTKGDIDVQLLDGKPREDSGYTVHEEPRPTDEKSAQGVEVDPQKRKDGTSTSSGGEATEVPGENGQKKDNMGPSDGGPTTGLGVKAMANPEVNSGEPLKKAQAPVDGKKSDQNKDGVGSQGKIEPPGGSNGGAHAGDVGVATAVKNGDPGTPTDDSVVKALSKPKADPNQVTTKAPVPVVGAGAKQGEGNSDPSGKDKSVGEGRDGNHTEDTKASTTNDDGGASTSAKDPGVEVVTKQPTGPDESPTKTPTTIVGGEAREEKEGVDSSGTNEATSDPRDGSHSEDTKGFSVIGSGQPNQPAEKAQDKHEVGGQPSSGKAEENGEDGKLDTQGKQQHNKGEDEPVKSIPPGEIEHNDKGNEKSDPEVSEPGTSAPSVDINGPDGGAETDIAVKSGPTVKNGEETQPEDSGTLETSSLDTPGVPGVDPQSTPVVNDEKSANVPTEADGRTKVQTGQKNRSGSEQPGSSGEGDVKIKLLKGDSSTEVTYGVVGDDGVKKGQSDPVVMTSDHSVQPVPGGSTIGDGSEGQPKGTQSPSAGGPEQDTGVKAAVQQNGDSGKTNGEIVQHNHKGDDNQGDKAGDSVGIVLLEGSTKGEVEYNVHEPGKPGSKAPDSVAEAGGDHETKEIAITSISKPVGSDDDKGGPGDGVSGGPGNEAEARTVVIQNKEDQSGKIEVDKTTEPGKEMKSDVEMPGSGHREPETVVLVSGESTIVKGAVELLKNVTVKWP